MSAFKGTPGPWMVGETLRADALAVIGDGDSVVCEFTDRLGASVDADARLIASAPNLLEALRKVDEQLGDVECDSAADARAVEGCHDIIRAAIAKATRGAA